MVVHCSGQCLTPSFQSKQFHGTSQFTRIKNQLRPHGFGSTTPAPFRTDRAGAAVATPSARAGAAPAGPECDGVLEGLKSKTSRRICVITTSPMCLNTSQKVQKLPRTLLQASQNALCAPPSRDVFLYAERATFCSPVRPEQIQASRRSCAGWWRAR